MVTKQRFNFNLLQVVSLSQYNKMKKWSKARIWAYIKENWPECYTVYYGEHRGFVWYTKRDMLESLSIAEYINN
jgi:hypothetical protein